MPHGGEVVLSTRLGGPMASNAPRHVVLAVSDQGVGMDPSTLEKARVPFFTLRDVGQGVGLGLSFIDGTARIAGGELTLISSTGSGTTVEMHLPSVV